MRLFVSPPHRRKTRLITHTENLPAFQSRHSYDILHIRRSTTQAVLNEMIAQVRCTRQFAIATKPSLSPHDTMFMYLELIQTTRSLVIVIDYDHARDVDTTFASIIRQIFSFVFQTPNSVHTWTHLRRQLRYFLPFELSNKDQLVQVCAMDVQSQFEQWYHRSKSSTDDRKNSNRWTLSDAIALCFNEYLDPYLFDINHCLAISKLSKFIRGFPSETFA